MSNLYLLDTNTVSYVVKGKFPRVRQRLARVPMAQVAISVVTEGELRFGLERRPESKQLRIAVEEFLVRVNVLTWNSETAVEYAKLRAALERAGTPVGNLDLMIAAQAVASDAVLVTNDAALRRIKRLNTEDWTK
jgi:tRNA(fMet)-specific endonuclease VapC